MSRFHVTAVHILIRDEQGTVTTLIEYPMDRVIPKGSAIGLQVFGHHIHEQPYPFVLERESDARETCPQCGVEADHPSSIRQWTQDGIGVISIGWKCVACGCEFGHGARQ